MLVDIDYERSNNMPDTKFYGLPCIPWGNHLGNSTAKFQPTLNLYQHDLAEEDLSSYVIN